MQRGTYDNYNTFENQTDAAVKKVQSDAGPTPDGKFTPMLFKAVLNTDGLVLSYKGDPTIRLIQQELSIDYISLKTMTHGKETICSR